MSFDIALSGIQAINEQLNTISHNIANAGTYGFKSSRTNFSAIYAGSQGAGVEVGSVSQNIALSGSSVATGSSMNAAIDGKGFFVTTDNTGIQSYTRVGLFKKLPDGSIVDTNNRNILGYPTQLDSAGRPIPGAPLGALGPLKVPASGIPASASNQITFNGNLSSNWTVPTGTFDAKDSSTYNLPKTTTVYDSQGNPHEYTQYFVKTAANTIDVYFYVDGTEVPTVTNPNPAVLEFDTNGILTSVNAPGTTMNVAMDDVDLGTAVAPLQLKVDFTGTTQFAGDVSTTTWNANGNESGTLVNVELGTDGSVIAKYSNKQAVSYGRVAIANFRNPDDLRPVNDTSWVATQDSGEPLIDAAGSAGTANLMVERVEQSNVDITAELVGLMTSQRNYQANSKVITTENQMLQSLMQAL